MTNEFLTPERRSIFEQRGLDLLKMDLANPIGYHYLTSSSDKNAAIQWIKEQEEKKCKLEQDRHDENIRIARESRTFAKWAVWIAIASFIVSLIALVATLKPALFISHGSSAFSSNKSTQ
jgi:hypothetical protein